MKNFQADKTYIDEYSLWWILWRNRVRRGSSYAQICGNWKLWTDMENLTKACKSRFLTNLNSIQASPGVSWVMQNSIQSSFDFTVEYNYQYLVSNPATQRRALSPRLESESGKKRKWRLRIHGWSRWDQYLSLVSLVESGARTGHGCPRELTIHLWM